MNDVERLVAIEAIKQAKARYFWGLDHKDWELWRSDVWAPDGRLEVPEIDVVIEPFDKLVAWVSQMVQHQVSVHHGHMPIIDFTSDTTARVAWAMEDRLYVPQAHAVPGIGTYFHGFGHYRETYVKLDVGWRIQSSRLTRLRIESKNVVDRDLATTMPL